MSRRLLVVTLTVTVHDLGPAAVGGERYQAELAGYAAVQEAGASPWEAVRRLVVDHRPLLERRWAAGGPPP
jgi:hypothetical protein